MAISNHRRLWASVMIKKVNSAYNWSPLRSVFDLWKAVMLGHIHFCFQAIFYLVYISCCHQLDLCIQNCLVYLMQWNKALLKTLSSNILISLLTLVETESSLWVSSNFMWTKTNRSELWKVSTHNQHVGDFIDRHNKYTLRLSQTPVVTMLGTVSLLQLLTSAWFASPWLPRSTEACVLMHEWESVWQALQVYLVYLCSCSHHKRSFQLVCNYRCSLPARPQCVCVTVNLFKLLVLWHNVMNRRPQHLLL